MAGRMNRFGCLTDDVLSMFATGSYVPVEADFGGAASIEQSMDLVTDEIIQMMPEDMFQSMFDVVLEKVEIRATQGQTAFHVSLFPTVSGKTHVWSGQPVMFKTRPRLLTDLLTDMTFTDPELIPLAEKNTNQFSFTDATGVGAFTAGNELKTNDLVFVTYSVDPATLNIASLKQVVAAGTVTKIGSKFYSRASSQWQYIDDTREDYTSKIKALRDGKWIPPEIRIMRFWEERVSEEDKNAMIQIGRLIRA